MLLRDRSARWAAVAAGLATAAAIAATSAPAAPRQLHGAAPPIGFGGFAPVVHDRPLSAVRARKALADDDLWGGEFTGTFGDKIHLYATSDWVTDMDWLQAWADWMDFELLHGLEIDSVSVLFVLPEDTALLCGADALGCYDPETGLIVAPGNEADAPDPHLTASVLMHEYGHHLAAKSLNPPWDGSTYGPKRWASAAGVCRRVKLQTAFPGDEGEHYLLNPGEGFAEAYKLAVWKDRIWTNWPTAPEWLSDPSFTPDQLALIAIRDDVENPWKASTFRDVWAGRLPKLKTKGRTVSWHTLATPLDGTMTVQLYKPIGAVVTLTANNAILKSSDASFSYTVCGQRSFRLRIQGPSGAAFRVVMTVP